jgi:hypothetical protein
MNDDASKSFGVGRVCGRDRRQDTKWNDYYESLMRTDAN